MVPRRLQPLEEVRLVGGLRIYVARSFRARLLGLALLAHLPDDCALLLPRCASIHTFGMRFLLDIAFLDADGDDLRVIRRVGPCRFARCRGAVAALEWRSSDPRSSGQLPQSIARRTGTKSALASAIRR